MVSKSVLQEQMAKQEYKYGFVSDLDEDKAPKGLNEDIVRLISRKKNEPEWFLEWRLRAYRHWLTMKEPKWSNVTYPPINYQDIIYYAAPKPKKPVNSLEDVDPEIRNLYEKLGIPLIEQDPGQFERTLIIADEGAYVSSLEGCTAPIRDTNQLHAAVVELIALDNAEIKYSTIQNWYPGDKNGKGGIYNFVTKRGKALGANSKVSWTQVETGSAITWKYPSCILQGDNSVGEFYSVALVNNYQQADTGTKMLHIGKNTRSTIISKGISAGYGRNTYRGRVQIHKGATNARNYSQCDSLLIGSTCAAFTFPDIQVQEPTAQMEHEASTSKIGEEQLFYCQTRGITPEDATNMIVNGFCKQVFLKLPMEFAVEAQKLIGVSLNLEGTVG